MQFPVPQFTDVEDKIIGPLTLKQFGIVFGAGMIVVLVYTSTKNIAVGVLTALFVGLPALGVAFAPFNGRPFYNAFPIIVKFITSEKLLVFHKEAALAKTADKGEKKQAVAKPAAPQAPTYRLQEVNKMISEEARQEQEVLKKLKQ